MSQIVAGWIEARPEFVDATEQVKRLEFEKSVMQDELTAYAMREALLLECLKEHGIDPPEGIGA